MHHAEGWPIAAICAAPTILGKIGILQDKTAVCYPAMEGQLYAKEIGTCATVTDGNIITSKAAGTTFDFALQLLRTIKGDSEAAKVAEEMLIT
jgi:4-methyl-5(b-hydroxyethyl)-thiazole monophosphate biosynthesis